MNIVNTGSVIGYFRNKLELKDEVVVQRNLETFDLLPA